MSTAEGLTLDASATALASNRDNISAEYDQATEEIPAVAIIIGALFPISKVRNDQNMEVAIKVIRV